MNPKPQRHEPIEITDCPFKDSGYRSGDSYWLASTLVKAAQKQKCKPYKLFIDTIDLGRNMWNGTNVYSYAYHAKRMLATDLKYPVIVGPMGGIMDGWHRVAKALLEGKTYVLAMRLTELPKEDKEEE